jgi:hypothetical protein
MLYGFDSSDDIVHRLKRMESIVLGMKQLRGLVGSGRGAEIIESLIKEAESQIEETRENVL